MSNHTPGRSMATDIASKLNRPLLRHEAAYLRLAAQADGIRLTFRRYDLNSQEWIDCPQNATDGPKRPPVGK